MSTSNPFGRYLRKIRIDRHFRQREVALAIGKSTAYICDLEKGRRGVPGSIDPLLLIQLADFFNVPVSELLVRAGVIDSTFEAQYGGYFKILRSKMRAQRVGKCIEGCKKDIEQLKTLTWREVRGPMGDGAYKVAGHELVESLESRIVALEQTLKH